MNSVQHIFRLRFPLNKQFLRVRSPAQVSLVANYAGVKLNKTDEKTKDDVEVPENVHPLKDKYISTHQKQKGEINDTKPFKIRLQANKEYFWCLCGRSHSQPLCDGTHRDAYRKTPLRPVRFKVKEEKEYWLCRCKQTNLRPFCDGSHKMLPPKK